MERTDPQRGVRGDSIAHAYAHELGYDLFGPLRREQHDPAIEPARNRAILTNP